MKFKKGDYVRIKYIKNWPHGNHLDILDYGFIIGLDPDDKNYLLLKSCDLFQMVIRIKEDLLTKLLVEHSPKREFEYIEQFRSAFMLSSDIVWKLKSDRDDVVLLVWNARMEPDINEDGIIFYYPTWDKITKEDGSKLSEEEQDAYTSDLCNSLRALLTK